MARQFTVEETFERMVEDGCFKGGNLVFVPEWLKYPMLQRLIAAGYVDPLISIGDGGATTSVLDWA